MEAEAIISICKHIEYREWTLVGSGIINCEVDKTPDKERKARLQTLMQSASEFVAVDQDVHSRACEIESLGIKAYDALHVACAEQGKVDVLLSTDDKFLKVARQNRDVIRVEIENPLVWLQKVVSE